MRRKCAAALLVVAAAVVRRLRLGGLSQRAAARRAGRAERADRRQQGRRRARARSAPDWRRSRSPTSPATTSSSTSTARQRPTEHQPDPRRRASPRSSSRCEEGDYSIEPDVNSISSGALAVGDPTAERAERTPAALGGRREPPPAPEQFGDLYRLIYAFGAGGETPTIPVASAELAAAAEEAMEPRAAGYVFGSAGTEDTARENERAFAAWRIVPRVLRDISTRDLRPRCSGLRLARAGRPGADRRPGDRPSRRGARERPRRGGGRGADDRRHRRRATRSRRCGGARRHAARVPALLAQRPRARRELRRAAPRRPATARSSSPSTTPSPAGSRATCRTPTCRSSRAGAGQLLRRPGLPRLARAVARGGPGRRGRPLHRGLRQPGADLGRPRPPAGARPRCRSCSRGSSTPTTPARRASAESTASSSPTTAAARSTARSRRSTPCRRSPTRSARRWPSCSTAASAPAPTRSRRSPSGPTRSCRPPLPVGHGARGSRGGGEGPALHPRRARPDDGAAGCVAPVSSSSSLLVDARS